MAMRAVYTVVTGGYEELSDNHVPSPGVDHICLTDDPELTSEFWRIVLVEREFPSDPSRSQRLLKIVGHPALDSYDETVYVDNSVTLLSDVNPLFDLWLASSDMTVALHSFRDTVTDEFAAVLTIGYDDHQRVVEQWDHYWASVPDSLTAHVLWTGIIARRRSEDVTRLCRHWADHVLRYSRRDQLSLRAAEALTGVSVGIAHLDNNSSEWHQWPSERRRKTHMESGLSAARVPDLVAVSQARMAQIAAERESAEQRAAANALKSKLVVTTAQVHELESQLAVLAVSRSWKVTAPIRRLTVAMRRR